MWNWIALINNCPPLSRKDCQIFHKYAFSYGFNIFDFNFWFYEKYIHAHVQPVCEFSFLSIFSSLPTLSSSAAFVARSCLFDVNLYILKFVCETSKTRQKSCWLSHTMDSNNIILNPNISETKLSKTLESWARFRWEKHWKWPWGNLIILL